MKKIIIMSVLLIVSTSLSSFAVDLKEVGIDTENTKFVKNSRVVKNFKDKYGELTEGNVPCPCVFDKGRANYKKSRTIMGYTWSCKSYTEDGICQEPTRKKADYWSDIK